MNQLNKFEPQLTVISILNVINQVVFLSLI